MGKQVNFFMAADDERNFLESIRAMEPFVIFRNSFKSYEEKIVPIEEVAALEGNLSIYNLSLVRIADVESVKIKPVPNKDSYSVDVQNSPVVQFGRCEPKPEWLSSGRLWYQSDWFDTPVRTGEKHDEFCKWADALLKWVKKNYARVPDRPFYIGPVTAKRVAEGALKLPPVKLELTPEQLKERKRILGLDK